MGLLDRFRGGRPRRHNIPELDRATGAALGVRSVHRWGSSTERLAAVAVPAEGLAEIGHVVHVGFDGPGWVRPGDRSDPSPVPLRSVAELHLVRAGELEFRDTLGNRGLLSAGQVRLVSGGSGVTSEVGASRTVRRDGADIDLMSMRWLQPGPPATPTVRQATTIPSIRQGRSRISRIVGPDGAVTDPSGVIVWLVEVAAGGTVDLPIRPERHVGLIVRRGRVLLGAGLELVQAPASVVMNAATGHRLTMATHLDGDDGAEVLVVSVPVPASAMVHRHGVIAGRDQEDLAAALEVSRTDGFGCLPRLDG